MVKYFRKRTTCQISHTSQRKHICIILYHWLTDTCIPKSQKEWEIILSQAHVRTTLLFTSVCACEAVYPEILHWSDLAVPFAGVSDQNRGEYYWAAGRDQEERWGDCLSSLYVSQPLRKVGVFSGENRLPFHTLHTSMCTHTNKHTHTQTTWRTPCGTITPPGKRLGLSITTLGNFMLQLKASCLRWVRWWYSWEHRLFQ